LLPSAGVKAARQTPLCAGSAYREYIECSLLTEAECSASTKQSCKWSIYSTYADVSTYDENAALSYGYMDRCELPFSTFKPCFACSSALSVSLSNCC
jgi:hypothetical protein